VESACGVESVSQRLKSKVALITGAGSGIGKATAIRFAAEGCNVVITDIEEPSLKKVHEAILHHEAMLQLGVEALSLRLDVSQERDWIESLKSANARFGLLDVLVLSAGISFAKPVVDMSLEEWRRVMSINLDGVFLGVKHGLPLMKEGGSIVIVSSASGIKAAPGASAYAASKAALRLFAKSVALECAPRKIRVNTLHPAGVETPMWEAMPFFKALVQEHGSRDAAFKSLAAASPQGLQRFATPDEIASSILYLAGDESAFVTGTELIIDGGYTA
jgi:NAD(P)-dependent dehydrogenase (short-subunit alcohol dehydrogenase family)